MMARTLAALLVVMTAVVISATPLAAQTVNAEVRTWTGQVYQLTDSSLHLLYTIMVPKKDDAGGPADTAPTTGARAPMLFGNANAISQFLEKQPEPLQGHRTSDVITLRKDGAEVRVALTDVGALFFSRRRAASTLPHYVASEHYRYSAIAVLTDGSRIESDYVSLGTTFLRGRTANGQVDIPWQQIEVVRFTR
jgi:hypothetical protein